MKKYKGILIATAMLLGTISPYAVPVAKAQNVESKSTNEVVYIKDLYLKYAICKELDKSFDEDLTIDDLSKLEGLDITKASITSLDGLEYAINLKYLHASENKIEDLRPITNLKKMVSLNVSNNKITDLTPLKNLENLEILEVGYNNLNELNLSGANFTKLEELNISNNNLLDVAEVKNYTNLKILNASGNEIGKLPNLLSLQRLEEMDLTKNPMQAFAKAENQKLITEYRNKGILLTVNDDTPVEIKEDAVSDAIRQQLNLEDNSITKGNLTELTDLDISGQNVRSVEGIEGALNLTTLDAGSNSINNLQPLSNLTSLEILDMEDNAIENIGALKNLNNLEEVVLNSNEINDLAALNNKTSISRLSISNTNVKSLEDLKRLTNLEFLDANGSNIQDVTPLKGLNKLTFLDLGNNNITNLNTVVNLPINFNDINILGNPIVQEKEFKNNKNEEVSIHKDWTVTFSGEIDSASINSNFIYVKDEAGDIVPTNLTLSNNKKQVIVKAPENGYLGGSKYTLHILKQVKNKKGKLLKDYTVFNFETEETRDSQHVVKNPLMSERKLLKFADLSYVRFSKEAKNIYISDLVGNSVNSYSSNLSQEWDDRESGNKKVQDLYNKLFEKNGLDIISVKSNSETRSIKELSDWEYIKSKEKSGFYGVAFKNSKTNEIVIAYRGTEDDMDWGTNVLGIGLNLAMKQSALAMEFYEDVTSEYSTSNIFVTGHSLGGWLAQRVAVEFSNDPQLKKTITFNAPGYTKPSLSKKTYLRTKQWENNENHIYDDFINNIIIENDATGNIKTHLGETTNFYYSDEIYNSSWYDELGFGTVLDQHGLSRFYVARGYTTDAVKKDLYYDDITVIRDLGLNNGVGVLNTNFKYNEYTDLLFISDLEDPNGQVTREYNLNLDNFNEDTKIIIKPVVNKSQQIIVKLVEIKDNGSKEIFEKKVTSIDELVTLSVEDFNNKEPLDVKNKKYKLYVRNATPGDILKVKFGSDKLAMVQGHVQDSVNGEDLKGAKITFTNSGLGSSYTTTTDSDGMYSTYIPAASYDILIEKDGYQSYHYKTSILDSDEENKLKNISLTPKNGEGEALRAVLNWGTSPYDLDAHLIAYEGDQKAMYVYYRNKKDGKAVLDIDDRDGEGPETVTVSEIDKDKEYIYVVHNYSDRWDDNSMSMGKSKAQVRVNYKNETYTYDVPNLPGLIWYVFSIKDGKIRFPNQMSYNGSLSDYRSSFSKEMPINWNEELNLLESK